MSDEAAVTKAQETAQHTPAKSGTISPALLD